MGKLPKLLSRLHGPLTEPLPLPILGEGSADLSASEILSQPVIVHRHAQSGLFDTSTGVAACDILCASLDTSVIEELAADDTYQFQYEAIVALDYLRKYVAPHPSATWPGAFSMSVQALNFSDNSYLLARDWNLVFWSRITRKRLIHVPLVRMSVRILFDYTCVGTQSTMECAIYASEETHTVHRTDFDSSVGNPIKVTAENAYFPEPVVVNVWDRWRKEIFDPDVVRSGTVILYNDVNDRNDAVVPYTGLPFPQVFPPILSPNHAFDIKPRMQSWSVPLSAMCADLGVPFEDISDCSAFPVASYADAATVETWKKLYGTLLDAAPESFGFTQIAESLGFTFYKPEILPELLYPSLNGCFGTYMLPPVQGFEYAYQLRWPSTDPGVALRKGLTYDPNRLTVVVVADISATWRRSKRSSDDDTSFYKNQERSNREALLRDLGKSVRGFYDSEVIIVYDRKAPLQTEYLVDSAIVDNFYDLQEVSSGKEQWCSNYGGVSYAYDGNSGRSHETWHQDESGFYSIKTAMPNLDLFLHPMRNDFPVLRELGVAVMEEAYEDWKSDPENADEVDRVHYLGDFESFEEIQSQIHGFIQNRLRNRSLQL